MSISRHQAVGAYRRWEPTAFDAKSRTKPVTEPEPASSAPAEPPSPPPSPPPEPAALPEPMIKLPTADEIDSMFEAARREGHALGYGEGRELGYREGAAKAGEQASRLAALGSAFDEALAQIDGEIAEELTALAIEIARQVIRHTLADHPAAIVETVRTALQQLPQNQVAIQLHPDDASLVREYLADQLEHGRHQLIEDDTLSRGGCRVRAINCEIDATLETRWRRVLETIGRGDATWEEPQR